MFRYLLRAPLVLAGLATAATSSVTAQTIVASSVHSDTALTQRNREPGVPPALSTTDPSSPTPQRQILGLAFSGYLESAFNLSNRPNEQAIAGRLYDRANNRVAFNALTLSADRAFDATRLDVGFHADLILGPNASQLKSTGFDLGQNGDIYQLHATLNLPTANGHGVQVKVGRMSTFLGMELIETPRNPNVSIANQFIFVENFTQTGVSVEHRFNSRIDAQFRVFNGWDQVRDVNDRFSYMARVGFAPDSTTSIALAGFTGPEQAHDNAASRSGVEVLASRRTGWLTTSVQADIGMEQRNAALPDPTHNARWWATGAWFVIDASEHIGVALRGDYLVDNGSSRTSAIFGLAEASAHRLSSATATLNLRMGGHMLVRPELRVDRSNLSVFAAQQQQVTMGLNATYVF